MTDSHDERTAGGGFKPAPIPENETERLRELSMLGLTKFDEFGQTKTGGLSMKVSQAGKWIPWEQSDYDKGAKNLPKK